MLRGVELLGGPNVETLRSVAPGVVKLRDPRWLGSVEVALGKVPLLVRPRHMDGLEDSEGYRAKGMRASWAEWRGALDGHWTAPWWYECSNEPNHPRGPFGRDDVWAYEAEVREFLAGVEPEHRGRILLGGLVPAHGTWAWAQMYDRVQADFPGVGRAVHCYWQGSAQIEAGVADAVAQCSGRPDGVHVTEVGDSGWEEEVGDPRHEPEDQRIGSTRAAFAALERAGFTSCVLFSHDTGGNPRWQGFVFGADQQRSIVEAVPPFPGGEQEGSGGMSDRWQEFPVGPGIKAAMEARGDQPTAREWYPANGDGVEVGVSLAFGEKGQYAYSKVDNQVRFVPFA